MVKTCLTIVVAAVALLIYPMLPANIIVGNPLVSNIAVWVGYLPLELPNIG